MCNWYIQLIVIRGDRGFYKPPQNKVNCHAVWNFPWRPPAQNNIFHKIHFPNHAEEKYSGTVVSFLKKSLYYWKLPSVTLLKAAG